MHAFQLCVFFSNAIGSRLLHAVVKCAFVWVAGVQLHPLVRGVIYCKLDASGKENGFSSLLSYEAVCLWCFLCFPASSSPGQ